MGKVSKTVWSYGYHNNLMLKPQIRKIADHKYPHVVFVYGVFKGKNHKLMTICTDRALVNWLTLYCSRSGSGNLVTCAYSMPPYDTELFWQELKNIINISWDAMYGT